MWQTLRLLTVFVEKSGEPEASPKYLAQQVSTPPTFLHEPQSETHTPIT